MYTLTNRLHGKQRAPLRPLGLAWVRLAGLATLLSLSWVHAATGNVGQAAKNANPIAVNTHVNTVKVTLRIAVAANFSNTLRQLRHAFVEQNRLATLELKLISGATGALYNQIVNGAPFDIFFAADSQTPALLAKQTIGDASTLLNYASGHMVLLTKQALASKYGPGCDRQAAKPLNQVALRDILQASQRIVIANPKIAPYGAASLDVLYALQGNATGPLTNKQVVGRNVMHAQQLFVHSDADAALMSLAQLRHMHRVEPQSASQYGHCSVNASLHRELAQAAIQIVPHRARARGFLQSERKSAAQQFMDFVQSPTGAAIIRSNGYSLPRSTK
ncbi:MAG: molybdate ABC transporter substrate-binding protein [Pseudomonadales bacterium]|nr:molybdate ABC transporter substrate-binding protein [Pseudomonadales bacterium]